VLQYIATLVEVFSHCLLTDHAAGLPWDVTGSFQVDTETPEHSHEPLMYELKYTIPAGTKSNPFVEKLGEFLRPRFAGPEF